MNDPRQLSLFDENGELRVSGFPDRRSWERINKFDARPSPLSRFTDPRQIRGGDPRDNLYPGDRLRWNEV